MKRYLIRGGRLPTEQFETVDYLHRNLMGSNVGNFLYLNAILRTLVTDKDVLFEPTRYRYHYSDKEIDRINAEYDGFVIPLADAFRAPFLKEMRGLTALVKKLNIPCYIIGVGVQAGAEEKLAAHDFGFEDDARAFVGAVLEKSAIIGVRGAVTAQFLEYLGFAEGRHFTVIGCPSMYTFGTHLAIRDTVIDPDCRVAYNATYHTDAQTLRFVERSAAQFSDIIFIPQLVSELKTVYWGVDYDKIYREQAWDTEAEETVAQKSDYPDSLSHPMYAQNRVRFFVNENDWLDFLRTRDFVFGTRLHGNIAATLAGTPSLMITKDVRMREVAAFHGLNAIDECQLAQYPDIWAMIAAQNFHAPEQHQRKNFLHFLRFLHQNGMQTIYDDDIDRRDAPLDDMLAQNSVHNEFKPAAICTGREIANRMLASVCYYQDEAKSTRDQCSKQKKADHEKQKTLMQDLTKLRTSCTKLKQANDRLSRQHAELKLRVDQLQSAEKAKDAELKSHKRELKLLMEKYNYSQNVLNCRSIRYTIRLRNLFLPKERKIKIEPLTPKENKL